MKNGNFIMLDALAGHRGGVAKLNYDDQLTYIISGIEEGFLSREEAYEIAKKLTIQDHSILKAYFEDINKDNK